MPLGLVKYWNGLSGWVTPINATNSPTAQARDVLIATANMLVASSAALFSNAIGGNLSNATVSYATPTDAGSAIALTITLT